MVERSRNDKVSMERLSGYLNRKVEIEVVSTIGVQEVKGVLRAVVDFNYIKYVPSGPGVSSIAFGYLQFVGSAVSIRTISFGDRFIYDNGANIKPKNMRDVISDGELRKLRVATFGSRNAAKIDDGAYMNALCAPIKLREERDLRETLEAAERETF